MGSGGLTPAPDPTPPAPVPPDPVVAALTEVCSRRWLLVGVGSDLRGDDAFGPLLARRLLERGLPALDAGTSPENVTGAVLRAAPEVLLLADAGDLGEPPGTLRLLPPGALAEGGTSTHDPSLRLLLTYLAGRRAMEVRVLVCQIATTAFGLGAGPATLDAVERAARVMEGPPPAGAE